MTRWVISFGAGSALVASNAEQMVKQIRLAYKPDDFLALNHTPASISQILSSSTELHVNKLNLWNGLLVAAEKLDLKDAMVRFLSIYPNPTYIS